MSADTIFWFLCVRHVNLYRESVNFFASECTQMILAFGLRADPESQNTFPLRKSACASSASTRASKLTQSRCRYLAYLPLVLVYTCDFSTKSVVFYLVSDEHLSSVFMLNANDCRRLDPGFTVDVNRNAFMTQDCDGHTVTLRNILGV